MKSFRLSGFDQAIGGCSRGQTEHTAPASGGRRRKYSVLLSGFAFFCMYNNLLIFIYADLLLVADARCNLSSRNTGILFRHMMEPPSANGFNCSGESCRFHVSIVVCKYSGTNKGAHQYAAVYLGGNNLLYLGRCPHLIIIIPGTLSKMSDTLLIDSHEKAKEPGTFVPVGNNGSSTSFAVVLFIQTHTHTHTHSIGIQPSWSTTTSNSMAEGLCLGYPYPRD